jgi:hypothetical protein
MFVRVFDSQRNNYFKSAVYAVINSGWYEKQLVVFSSNDGSYFKFFDYLDKSDPKAPEVLINSIISSGVNPDFEWTYKRNEDVDKKLEEYEALLDDDIRFFEYRGYSWIYENKLFLTELLRGGTVSTKDYEQQILAANSHRLDGWNYVEKQHDIDFIFEQTSGFHDSVLRELNYTSGAYVDDENRMYCTDSVRQVTMRFDSQWCRSIEMVFEGVVALNLRPYSDNFTSFLYDASMFVQDETIFFFDSHIEEIDKNYDGTWIKSYGLRWRFYGNNRDIDLQK